MANPNPQLQAAIAQFAAQPGVTLDKEAQLHIAPTVDTSRLITRLVASLFVFAWVVTLSACATTPTPIPLAKGAIAPTSQSASITSNPNLTAEEIGKRFLKLVKGLESRNDLSLERIREVTGIALTLEPEALGVVDWSHDLGGGWRYAFDYVPESSSTLKGVGLTFANNSKDHISDVMPVCSLDFEYYHNALVEMGFMAEPYYGEHNLLLGWRYTKFKKSDGTVDMTISILQMAGNEPDHPCVKSISTLNGR